MKSVLIALILVAGTLYAQDAGFVHPLDFRDTQTERDRVIRYIVSNVRATYSQIGMDDPSTLRLMEKQELDAFKKLTDVNNRPLLDRVIKTYCGIGMCSYGTILLMYEQESKASGEELKW